jgi:hypothetical protein
VESTERAQTVLLGVCGGSRSDLVDSVRCLDNIIRVDIGGWTGGNGERKK